MPARTNTTVEINVMDLFGSIDRKLDSMAIAMGTKADAVAFVNLSNKVSELEVHGSNNAQAAAAGVTQINKQLSDMGWKIAASLAGTGIALIGTLVMAMLKIKG